MCVSCCVYLNVCMRVYDVLNEGLSLTQEFMHVENDDNSDDGLHV